MQIKGPRMRLLIAVSAVWILVFFFYTESSPTYRLFLFLGVLPVIVFWLLVWVRAARPRNEARGTSKRWPWQRR